MCTKQEVHQEMEPLKKSIDRAKNWLLVGLISSVGIWIGVGSWVGTIQNEVKNIREQMLIRTEDRFYAQDGEILEQQILQNKEAVGEIKASLLRIEEKLDRAL